MRTRVFTFALIVCLAATPALADIKTSTPNAPTKPFFIALLYNRLLGTKPNIESWVEDVPDYPDDPTPAQKEETQKKEKDLSDTFDMLTGLDPIYVNAFVPLAGYDAAKNAFYIDRFDKYAFYNYTYLGKNYAVIPHGIDAYQWLHVTKAMKDTVWEETDHGKKAHIRLTLISRSADRNMMTIGGKDYHLLMANVLKVELWSKDDSRVIWDDSDNEPSGLKHRLLELYQ